MANNIKDIADMLTTVEDWLATIDMMQQQPEFAHSEFFSLLADIITDAKHGRRKEELLHKCQAAAEMAQTLYNETGMPQFAEWGICLADYTKTWTDSDDPALFANPLLQAEISHLKERAAKTNDPVKKFTAALLDANKRIQESAISDVESMKQAADAVQSLSEPIADLRRYISLFAGTEQGQQLKTLLEETEAALQRMADEAAQIVQGNLDIISSYLDKEIQKPQYGGLTMKEIMEQSRDENGEYISGSLFEQACKGASQAMRNDGKADEDIASLEAISYITSHQVQMAVDKAAGEIWAWNAQDAEIIDGQQKWAALGYEGKDSEKQLNLLYNFQFDEAALKRLGIETKKLDYYDFFVQTICGNLYASGNKDVSLSKIYKELEGGSGKKPAQKQLKKLYDSIQKQLSITVVINDKDISEAWGVADPKATYKEIVAPLLPAFMGTEKFIVNGKIVDSRVKLLAVPPFMQIAKKIGQYTTFPKSLLENNIRKTDRYYKALFFLIREISHMKHPTAKRTHKIRYKTFYGELGETTLRKQELAKDMLYSILEHFRKEGWIFGYKEEIAKSTGDVGVRIFLSEAEKKLLTKR